MRTHSLPRRPARRRVGDGRRMPWSAAARRPTPARTGIGAWTGTARRAPAPIQGPCRSRVRAEPGAVRPRRRFTAVGRQPRRPACTRSRCAPRGEGAPAGRIPGPASRPGGRCVRDCDGLDLQSTADSAINIRVLPRGFPATPPRSGNISFRNHALPPGSALPGSDRRAGNSVKSAPDEAPRRNVRRPGGCVGASGAGDYDQSEEGRALRILRGGHVGTYARGARGASVRSSR